jgi:DNA invertase Pin-like site-specific DNA recombinase
MVGIIQRAKKRMVAVNDRGARIGEGHPRAVLTDHDVALVIELRDQGMSLGKIAIKFGVSKGCVWKIITGRTRWQNGAWVVR